MKMKISDVIRNANDNDMAKIIGATVAQHIEGISAEEATKLDYPHTLQVLQKEIEVDYKQTNADRIRAMSDEELAQFLSGIFSDWHKENLTLDWNKEIFSWGDKVRQWLRAEVKE